MRRLGLKGVRGKPVKTNPSAERGLHSGVRRGKPVKTTVSNPETAGPEDRVNRPFTAERPNALWVSDFT
jgi:transposase InsO family protein